MMLKSTVPIATTTTAARPIMAIVIGSMMMVVSNRPGAPRRSRLVAELRATKYGR